MKALRPLIVCTVALTLTACGTALVSPDKASSLGNGISVMPQRPWNRIAADPETWTTQGPQIDQVRFFADITSGHPLLPNIRDERLNFDAKMLPNDIQDLVVATLQREGNKTVQTGNLSPCPFGASKGFCFDLSFASPAELEMKAMVMARKQNDKLDLILFQAPAEYYFGELSPTVAKMFASAQTK
jgi:hypothetical protein